MAGTSPRAARFDGAASLAAVARCLVLCSLGASMSCSSAPSGAGGADGGSDAAPVWFADGISDTLLDHSGDVPSNDAARHDASTDREWADAELGDSGGGDSGPEDAGLADSGAGDFASEDLGIADSGVGDFAAADPGVQDEGGEDVGVEDAGVEDAGVGDAGGEDAGVEDSAVEDAGVEDVAPPPPDPNVHAAPTGAGQECSLGNPCALLNARDRARMLRQSGVSGIVVWLHGGRYVLAAPLELGEEDSGSAGEPARFEAWPGDPAGIPILSGGTKISGWKLDDPGKGLWRASVPAGLNTRQLFVNGVRAVRARGMEGAGFTETPTGYTGAAGMAGWHNLSDIEMVHLNYWKSFRCPIASIQGNDITMAQPCWSCAQFHQGFDMGVPSWVENAFELLDTAGEWYLDRSESALYYLPRPGENLSTADVVVPLLERLVHISGGGGKAHHIRLRGIGFAHTTWLRPGTPDGYAALQAGYFLTAPSWGALDRIPGAVVVENADDVEILDSTFTRLGTTGIEARQACHRMRVEGNRFEDLSGGAVYVGTVDLSKLPDDASACVDTVVRNNQVAYTGVEFHDNVGLFAGYTVRTLFEHNRLHHLPYSAMSVGWGWSTNPTLARENKVRANQVSFPMRRLADGGCIYTLSRQPDSRIEANWFHGQVHDFGAVYLDQGTMGYTVFDNVVASAPYWYLLQPVVPPQAQENTVQHNVADNSSSYCCGGLGCCTQWNTVNDNEVVAPGAWPGWARLVMGDAGLEPAFRSLAGKSVRVEAEDYDHGGEGVGYHDLTAGNAGGAQRYDAVDVYPSPFRSGGFVVGYTQTGEWLAYEVDVPFAGWYDLAFEVGTQSADCAITVTVDGGVAGSVALPNTGSWNSFQTAVLQDVPLNAGPHRVVLSFQGAFNIDVFTLGQVDQGCAVPGTPPAQNVQGDFDGDGAQDLLGVQPGSLCWEVSLAGKTPSPWLLGWGTATVLVPGDFSGDGRSDVVLILQQSLTWHLAVSQGGGFIPFSDALKGWGGGAVHLAADVDGDGDDDLVLVWKDGATWRWHVARSERTLFTPYADVLKGVAPGDAVNICDRDADGAEEIEMKTGGQWTCVSLDAGAWKLITEPCSPVC